MKPTFNTGGARECTNCDGHGIMVADGERYFAVNPMRCPVCLGAGWIEAQARLVEPQE